MCSYIFSCYPVELQVVLIMVPSDEADVASHCDLTSMLSSFENLASGVIMGVAISVEVLFFASVLDCNHDIVSPFQQRRNFVGFDVVAGSWFTKTLSPGNASIKSLDYSPW